jgi:SWIM/SEC-C metal-binding protein
MKFPAESEASGSGKFETMEVRVAKLGSHQRPAVVRVQSREEAAEIVDFAQERGWQVIVGVEPDEPEDLSDLHKLMNAEVKPETKPRLPPKISGNDYCPCRSGKKFKKCCGAAMASPGAAREPL